MEFKIKIDDKVYIVEASYPDDALIKLLKHTEPKVPFCLASHIEIDLERLGTKSEPNIGKYR